MLDKNLDLEQKQSVDLMEFLEVLWKRKWLIVIPTIGCALFAGIISLFLPQLWETNIIIRPGKFVNQTAGGGFETVVAMDPRQIAGQINQEAYNSLIAAECNIDIRRFPELIANVPKDTQLVKVSLRNEDANKGKLILNSLFSLIKRDLDRRIDVEVKSNDAQILANENTIKQKNLDIQSSGLEKDNARKEISSLQNKVTISELRAKNLLEEMIAVKKRTDTIEDQQKKAFAEKREGTDTLSLLLYFNEIQNNLRYYNTLEDSLSNEKVNQENMKLNIESKENAIKQIDTRIEKTKNEIENVNNQNTLLTQKKGRIDFTNLIKEPTTSLYPVAPSKTKNVILAGFVALMIFTILALFVEYLNRYKNQRRIKYDNTNKKISN